MPAISDPARRPLRDLLVELQSAEEGLISEAAAARLRQYGPNELPAAPPANPLTLLFDQLTHTLALLLWTAAAIAFVAGIPQIGWAILAIVLVNAFFSFWQEYRAGQLGRAFTRRMPRAARVMRDRAEHRVPARELVPGDVILLRPGERVSADARVLSSVDLRLDYSVVSGESEPVERSPTGAPSERLEDCGNCVLAGTTIVRGSGRALVFATAGATRYGAIAALSERRAREPTPLQRQLSDTARTIALIALLIGAFFFAIGDLAGGVSTEDSFIFALGILVALIPEGLLPTVTLALALGMQRMGQRQALVKRLSSVEALGCTQVICTDKTGTITLNEMTVRELWLEDARYRVTGRGYSLRGRIKPPAGEADARLPALDRLLTCAVLCNDGVPPQPHRHRAGLGDPLDEALLVMAMKADRDPDALRQTLPRVKEFPFDPIRRRMSTIHTATGHASAGTLIVFVKGGPLEVLQRASREQTPAGVRPLGDERRTQIIARTSEMTARGLRVLAFAYRESDAPPETASEAESELIFLGVAGLDNPLRPEVPRAVSRCHEAGIAVVMLTGDHAQTALTVAREAGITDLPDAPVVTGAEIDALTDEQLDTFLQTRDPRVFARVAPEQKLRLVQSYRRQGKVVAVTGDGVNDAPALHAADVGVAMGKRGTDVAREAADMVLLDDNFATIVSAVEEGRAVYSNIRKFLTYFLTSNVAEALPFVVFVLFAVPLPLTVLQILLVDLGTDLLPGLALGGERPEPGSMTQPPRGRGQHIITGGLLIRALGVLGPLAALLSLGAYFAFQWDVTGAIGEYIDEGALYRQATTITFAGIVACQIGNAFACRSERDPILRLGLRSNPALLWAIGAEVLLLAIVIAVPPLRHTFDLEPIEPRYWPLLALFPPLFLLTEELRKAAASLLRRTSSSPIRQSAHG